VAAVLGLLLAGAALPAGAVQDRSVSSSNLKKLESSINQGNHLTYSAVYKEDSGGQTQTVTVAQSPPRSSYRESGSIIIDTGKKTYSCSTSSGSSKATCVSLGSSDAGLGLTSLFSTAPAEAALAEAQEGVVSRILGIKVSSSSAKFGGQAATCVSVTDHGKGGKYCVTKQGVLAYAGSSSSSYFELTKYSSSPSSSLFALPSGATTVSTP
jgi:outer membrane lipoprotein-sorting protein